jgi:hypothetical protein
MSPFFFYVGVGDDFFLIFPSTTNLKGVFFLKSQSFLKFLFKKNHYLFCYCISSFCFFFDKVGFHFIL